MKRLILLLFFISFGIQSWTKADDIRDFQIEGMSIGDSLLDTMSAKEIENKDKKYHYSTKDYYQIAIYDNLNIYELVTIHLKSNDKKYIIENISGVLEFKEKNNQSKKKCKNIMKDISASLLENFDLTNIEDEGKSSWDKSGKSTYIRNNFKFSNANRYQITVICQFWDVSTPFSYVLKTTISSLKFLDYLSTKAYN